MCLLPSRPLFQCSWLDDLVKWERSGWKGMKCRLVFVYPWFRGSAREAETRDTSIQTNIPCHLRISSERATVDKVGIPPLK